MENIKNQSGTEEAKAYSTRGRDLFTKEDWLAVWIGFIVICIACISVISGRFDFSAAKFSTWGLEQGDLIAQLTSSFFHKLALTFFVLGIPFTIGVFLQKKNVKEYILAYVGLFVIAVLVRLVNAQYTMNRYLEWAFFALIAGMIITNTVRVPQWLKPAVKPEFYIKTGLVIMGFSVLFTNIINFGLYGLGIAWGVTPIVIIFMWFFGIKVLKIDNRPLVITLVAATSVCGTSAAIAVGASSKAKKTDISLVVSISILFTIIMMVFEPIIIRSLGLGELMGGALIGGTIDSTGAVTVAGTVLGETAQTTAVLVKSIQNILIGFIAFAVAVFFTTADIRDMSKSKNKKLIGEIWYRLPKFIIGFFFASMIASFVLSPMVGKEAVNTINKVLDQYKNWTFVLAFISIGLDTNFSEIKEQFQGGKPLVLYIVGQLFNILLTFLVVYILLSGKLFPLPDLIM